MNVYDKIGSKYDSMRSNIGVKDILQETENLGRDIDVLDLGCGTGHPIAQVVSPNVRRYLGIDNSRSMLDAYKENVQNPECMLLDMSEIKQVTGNWNFIFSWGAICHLPVEMQRKTIKDVSRMLKPEGRFLFTSGEEVDQCTGTVGEYTVHHYSMGKSAYVEMLEEHGMELIGAGYSEGDFFVYRFIKRT